MSGQSSIFILFPHHEVFFYLSDTFLLCVLTAFIHFSCILRFSCHLLDRLCVLKCFILVLFEFLGDCDSVCGGSSCRIWTLASPIIGLDDQSNFYYFPVYLMIDIKTYNSPVWRFFFVIIGNIKLLSYVLYVLWIIH
jgi:hypothetical protein